MLYYWREFNLAIFYDSPNRQIKVLAKFSRYTVLVSVCQYQYVGLHSYFLPATREPAGPKIALRFPRLFVCLYVCLCVRTYHVRNITSCVTMQLQSTTVLTAFGGLLAKIQQPSIDLCCLDGEKVVGRHDNPVLATYSC